MVKTDRKRKKATFFLFLIFSLSSVQPQEVYEIIYNLLNDYSTRRSTITDLQFPYLQVGSGYSVHNYYREKTGTAITQILEDDVKDLFIEYITKNQKLSRGYSIELGSQALTYSNQTAQVAVTGDLRNQVTKTNLALALLFPNNLLVRAGIKLKDSEFSMPVSINEFPLSTDKMMNTFFLDWLQPSFGDSLRLYGDSQIINPDLTAILPLSGKLDLNLGVSYTSHIFSPVLSYQNNSNIVELTGQRKIDCPGNRDNITLTMGLGFKSLNLTPVLTVFTNSLDLKFKNQLPPDVIDDFPQLGSASFNQAGGELLLKKEWKKLELSAGMGYSKWNISSEVTTPVLGRYILFPVAHSVEMDLNGSILSEQIALKYCIPTGNIINIISADYTHGYYTTDMNGAAHLEFNLASTPIDYDILFHLHLLHFHYQLDYTWEYLTLSYGYHQYLPWTRRVDDSPVKFSSASDIPDRSITGGGHHQIRLSYIMQTG